MKQNAIFKRQKIENEIFYKMAISHLGKFSILTPKNSKNCFFWKILHKIKNFQNFQKTGIYVREPSVDNTYTKFQRDTFIFDWVTAL